MRVVCGVVALSEDPETVPSHGVSGVIVELIERNLVRAVVHCPGGAIWELGRSQPEAEVGSSSTGIVAELVVGVDNPEAGGVDIGVQKYRLIEIEVD